MAEAPSGRRLATAARALLALFLVSLTQCSRVDSGGGLLAAGKAVSLDALGPAVFQLEAAVVDGDMHGTFASVFVQVIDPAQAAMNPPAPVVHSVTADVASTPARGTVHLSAAASGSGGAPLQYVWIAPAGSLGGGRTADETWTAPSQPGTYTLQVMVTDGITWSGGHVTIPVTGPAATTGTGNHPPALFSLTASAVTVAPGAVVTLTLDAADVEGDPLSYGWAAPSGGTLGSSTGPVQTWTAPAGPGPRPAWPGRWVWPRVAPAGCPFAWSSEVLGLAFTGRAATQHFCDTWMPAWASDGTMVSPWQDGVLLTPPFRNLGGWLGTSEPAQNGWARIAGDDPQDLLMPAAGLAGATKGSWAGRYPAAMFEHDGTIYFGTRFTAVFDVNGNPTSDLSAMYRWGNGPFAGFRTSTDGGASWTESPCTPTQPLFPETATGSTRVKFGQPYLVDFGRNQSGSPDGKVYFVSTGSVDGSQAADHLNDDQVYLCRVSPSVSAVNDASKYEFYAGNGTWSASFAASRPILEWRNHFSGATATWNPGLGKFLLFAYLNGYTVTGGSTSFQNFDTYVLEAPALTGPWSLVAYLPSFGTQGYYPNLPSKFLSADGRTGWMWYGANFSPFDRASDPPGSGYHLCQQEVRFVLPSDLTPP
jgi:hypothetical protein